MEQLPYKLTNGELGAAAMSVLITGATDLRYLPFAALGLVAVGKLRRSPLFTRTISERLALMDYNEEEGTPLAGRLLAGLPIEPGTALARVEHEDKRPVTSAKKASKPSGRVKGAFGGMLADFAASISADGGVEVVQDEPEQPRKVTSKPVETVKAEIVDEDEAWLQKAAGSDADGLQALLKVLKVSEVCDRLNKQVDDFPHVFLVGNSGAGKTVFAQLLACTRPGKVVILDQKRPKGWEGPKWGGLPYVARDKDTASYGPMVEALRQVVAEMDRRYRMQDEATEPFEMLTVVLDEAKNSVEECEELATYYKKIVSIGREVGVRLILISTSDRARKLGFDGEADSMDSFAWVQFGEMAVKVQPSVKARGKERYYWGAVDMFGQWVPFENEKAFGLMQKLAVRPSKAWDKVKYNCQVPAKQLATKVTRPMQAISVSGGGPEDDELPVVNGYQYTAEDMALLARLTGGSVNNKSAGSGAEVKSTSALAEVQTSGHQEAVEVTSGGKLAEAKIAAQALQNVSAEDKRKLKNALQLYRTNGGKITPAIEQEFGVSGGRPFQRYSDWLKALVVLDDYRQASTKG